MKKKKRIRRVPLIVQKAEKALKVAVAKVIEEHRISGDPLVIWKKGKVVKISANQLLSHP